MAARSVFAADVDGDGDLDVLSASLGDDKIAWYENDGNQNFTAHIIYHCRECGLERVCGGRGRRRRPRRPLRVRSDDKIAWYENLNFVVVNTNDSGPGSLRQAIQQANANPGTDTITFAIGSGYQTIAPTSALPTITDPVIIDGTTQPGYAGAPLIEVWGFGAGPNVHGLVIAADNSTVKGLVVNLFDGNGILITGNNNRIENSYIGTDVSGTIAVPNALNGVEISGGSNNTIGGTDPGTANIIAFNGGQGVLVDTGAGNAIRRNSIHSNDGFGIALINGGNNNQAAPTVTRWTSVGGTTKVWLSLTSTPSTTFSIDVFRNTVCDPSGFGEGQAFLGTAMLTTDAGGTGSVIAVFGVGTPLNQFITATATSPTNDTSDFSNCRPFRLQAPFTADSVPPLPLPPLPPPASGTGNGEDTLDTIITPIPPPSPLPAVNPDRADRPPSSHVGRCNGTGFARYQRRSSAAFRPPHRSAFRAGKRERCLIRCIFLRSHVAGDLDMTREIGRKIRRRGYARPLLELLEARLVFASDFGDAPFPYPTLLAEGGAEHVAIGPTLGSQRDTEADGVHSPAPTATTTPAVRMTKTA